MIPLGALVFAAGATVLRPGALGACGRPSSPLPVSPASGIGFTFAAMPGFIVRAVPQRETGSATGFYQVLRSIGCRWAAR